MYPMNIIKYKLASVAFLFAIKGLKNTLRKQRASQFFEKEAILEGVEAFCRSLRLCSIHLNSIRHSTNKILRPCSNWFCKIAISHEEYCKTAASIEQPCTTAGKYQYATTVACGRMEKKQTTLSSSENLSDEPRTPKEKNEIERVLFEQRKRLRYEIRYLKKQVARYHKAANSQCSLTAALYEDMLSQKLAELDALVKLAVPHASL